MPLPRQPDTPGRILRSAAARRRLGLLEANAALARERQEALEAHRAKSAFLAGLSHRLRTPLNAILMCSELLSDDLKDQDLGVMAEDADRIHEAGLQLLAMLDDVLDLTRMEAGRMVFRRVPADPAALARKLLAAFEAQARSHDTFLSVTGAEALGTLQTDPDKLEQVLYHLLNNGLKFTRGGAVTLACRAEGADTVFAVRDTGIGMSSEQLARIRADFALTAHSRPPSYGNAGLGLTLCRVLAHGLGGSLEADCPPGGGSCFTLRLRG